MIRSRFFRNPEMGFETVGPPITAEQINRAIPEEFLGKDQFVKFYLCHNGGLMSKNTHFYRDIFHKVGPNDFNELYVHDFYSIPPNPGAKLPASILASREAIRQGCGDLRYQGAGGGAYIDFVDSHIPISGDASGDDIWIHIPSGRIRYVNFDCAPEDGPIEVAPSFIDFVSNLGIGLRPLPKG